MLKSLNFSDRKIHYSRLEASEADASDVMEYKFVRLKSEETDYRSLIMALKGYQFETHARPITIPHQGAPELPEQTFLRAYALNPQSVSDAEITSFVETVERGLMEEHNCRTLDRRRRSSIETIHALLKEKNAWIARGGKDE